MVFGVAAIGVVKCYYDAYKCVRLPAVLPSSTVRLTPHGRSLAGSCVNLYGNVWEGFPMRFLASLRALRIKHGILNPFCARVVAALLAAVECAHNVSVYYYIVCDNARPKEPCYIGSEDERRPVAASFVFAAHARYRKTACAGSQRQHPCRD